MKTKLQFLGLTAYAVILGFQTVFGQTGGAFGGVTQIIENGTIIEFENFDLGGNAFDGTAPFGYYDKTTGNATTGNATVASSSYRTATSPDADIAELVADTDFKYVGSVQGGEYFYYSITVGTTGKYHIDVNYAHGSATNKRIKIDRRDTDLTNTVVLVDGTTNLSDALPKTANSSTFETHSAGPAGSPFQFDLEAGKNYVIRFTFNDAGPNYNYFQFIRDGDASLGVNDINKEEKKIKAFPNPSNDGQFNLNIYTKWEVYSLLGSKIAQGEGTKVNLSNTAKGIYILKTAFSSNKLILK